MIDRAKLEELRKHGSGGITDSRLMSEVYGTIERLLAVKEAAEEVIRLEYEDSCNRSNEMCALNEALTAYESAVKESKGEVKA